MDNGSGNQTRAGLPFDKLRAGKSKLLKLIPSEIVAAYMVIHGIFQGQVITGRGEGSDSCCRLVGVRCLVGVDPFLPSQDS